MAELLRRVVDRTEYRAALAGSHHRYWRNLDKLLADAHRAGLVRVHAFLDYIRSSRDVGAREGEAPVEADGAVRLMTIHKAKGLEFPVVVLADAARRIRDRAEIAYLDGQVGLTFSPDRLQATPLAYRLARWLDLQQTDAEEARLLYVAATRAQEKLIISGHCAGSAGDWRADGWIKTLLEVADCDLNHAAGSPGVWHALDLGGGVEAAVTVAMADAEPGAWPGTGPASTAPASDEAPLYLPLVAGPADGLPSEIDEDTPRDWRATGERLRPPAAVVGLMVHQALRGWMFPGDPGLEAGLEAVALGEGLVDRRQRQSAMAEAARLLDRLRAHPLWEEISTSDERHHEVPYTRLLDEGRVESGVIDLLYRKGGEWRLIDFKIDELRDEQALQAARDTYRRQIERYTLAVRTLLGVPVAASLGFLDWKGEVRVETFEAP